ncbi:MAG: SHOCT domain-containing protein [candidate division WOR-3 bacterium]|nr:SHOCT domain-containing protein [candidate division WOR-3 bacterium]
MMGMSSNWGLPMFGGFFMILFWIAIIVGVIFLIKWLIGYKPAETQTKETPLEILKRRYAQGEITKEEFENKKRDLGYN